MHVVLLVIVFLGIIVGPGIWVRAVMTRYSRPAERYRLSGGDFARQVLDGLGLRDVRTEKTERGDHYDPLARTVRLSPANFDSGSLTAITVAAHEVGHAIQHARGFRPLIWRTRLIAWVAPIEKLGAGILMTAPFIAAAVRSPAIGVVTFLGGLVALGTATAVHALTLPTEFDASFARALPLLRRLEVLHPGDESGARRILTAAALTYVAASLASLLNIARWWAIIRR